MRRALATLDSTQSPHSHALLWRLISLPALYYSTLWRQALLAEPLTTSTVFRIFLYNKTYTTRRDREKSLRAETACPASETRWTRVASATEIYDISRFPFIQGRPRRTPGTLPRHMVLGREGRTVHNASLIRELPDIYSDIHSYRHIWRGRSMLPALATY
jgi:hypothetical protein